ncbi:MAG: DUF2079 domain-containing protein, partial [Candidatus Margulisbacteria bacterium]|nr:DUF2079 domain-containing protein [Candidatus Margulisiibacteriota bacterium]
MKILKKIFEFREQLSWWGILVAVSYYILVFSAYSILLQLIFYTQAFDSGIDDQGIWLLSRFLNPFVTVRGLNLFGDSVTLYHFIFAPFFWLWDNINILYIVQTVFLAIGAIPLFLYAREKLRSGFLAFSIGLGYLLYPAMQNLNLDQFHSEAVTVFFFIMTLYFLLKKNWGLFYVFFVISLLGKDEVALTGLFIGVYLLFFCREFKHGGVVMGLSFFWYLFCSRILMPLFNGVGVFDPQPLTYSHWFRGLMSNLFNPSFYWKNIFHVESLRYYLNLLSPLAFLPLARLSVLFLIIPSVAVNVLSGTEYLRSVHYHYNYIQTAVIFFALIEGLAFIRRACRGLVAQVFSAEGESASGRRPAEAGSRPEGLRYIWESLSVVLGLVVLGTSLWANIVLSHLPIHRHKFLLTEKYEWFKSPENQRKLKAL